jgi:hypothetical protein
VSLASEFTRREKQRRAIERIPAHKLFHRIVTRRGIDPAGVWRPGVEEMVFHEPRECQLCANTEVCRGWLRSDCRRASYVACCPNAELVQTCRILGTNGLSLNSELAEGCLRREPSLSRDTC